MNSNKDINMQDHLSGYTVEELQSYYSDFHKDFYGFRPRHLISSDQWRNREWLVDSINAIHDRMDEMKKTPAGREELLAGGWDIEAGETV